MLKNLALDLTLCFLCISITHMLQTNFSNYPKGEKVADLLSDLLGHGIFAVDGKAWEVQRKIASHMFSVSKLR